MSYILDALRKSEQERQLAEGKSAGVLYPVAVESRRSATPGRMIAGAVAFGLAAVAGSAYFLKREPPPLPSVPVPSVQAPSVEPPPPVPPVVVVKPVQEVAVPKPVVPVIGKKSEPAPAKRPEVAETRTDDIPPINISGYIRDGDAGGMAMINDKLVREGEEVAPGLRLEKILPEGAIFNYKGRRFTR